MSNKKSITGLSPNFEFRSELVSINLYPASDNFYDIGSSKSRWQDLFVYNGNFKNTLTVTGNTITTQLNGINIGNYIHTGNLAILPYVTLTYFNTTLANYATLNYLNSTYTTSEILDAQYLKIIVFNDRLALYSTTLNLNTKLDAYTKTTELNTALSAYTTTTGLNSLLNAYVKTTALNSALANYTTTAILQNLFTTKDLLVSTTTTVNGVTTIKKLIETDSFNLTTTLSGTTLAVNIIPAQLNSINIGNYVHTGNLANAVSLQNLITIKDLVVAKITTVDGVTTVQNLISTDSFNLTTTFFGTTLAVNIIPTQLNSINIGNYVHTGNLSNTLSGYPTNAFLTTTLLGYPTNSFLTTTLQGYLPLNTINAVPGYISVERIYAGYMEAQTLIAADCAFQQVSVAGSISTKTVTMVSGQSSIGEDSLLSQLEFKKGSTEGFRHFIRTRHFAGFGGNSIDFYINTAVGEATSTRPTGISITNTGNVLGCSIGSSGLGLGILNALEKLHVVGNILATGTIRGENLVATTALTSPIMTATGTITGDTLAATTALTAPTMTATGTITGATLTATTSLTAPTITATGTITGATLAATTALTAPTMTATGSITGATLTATTSLTAPTMTATGTITGNRLRVQAIATTGTVLAAHFSQNSQTINNSTLIAVSVEGGDSIYKSGLLYTRESSFDRGRLSVVTNNAADGSTPTFEAFTIARDGNVGIGNITPGSKLVVSGATNTGIIKLTNNTSNAADTWWLGFDHGTAAGDSNDRARIGCDIAAGGAGRIFFTTGNAGSQVERMRINELGNLGIASILPPCRLTVNQHITDANGFDHTISPAVITQTTPVTGSILPPLPVLHLCRQGTPGITYGSRATFELSRYEISTSFSRTRLDLKLAHGFYDNVDVMSFRSDGNIGIGTTIPTEKLHIEGNGIINNGNQTINTPISTATTNIYALKIRNSTITTDANVCIGLTAGTNTSAITAALKAIRSTPNLRMSMMVAASPGGTPDVEHFTVLGNGNVGIGTIVPAAKLHVDGNGLFKSSIAAVRAVIIDSSSESLNSELFLGTSNNGNGAQGLKTALIAKAATSWARADLHFCLNISNTNNTDNATVADSKMVIMNGGNVGIGTTNPTEKLHVAGNILVTGNLTAANVNRKIRISGMNSVNRSANGILPFNTLFSFQGISHSGAVGILGVNTILTAGAYQISLTTVNDSPGSACLIYLRKNGANLISGLLINVILDLVVNDTIDFSKTLGIISAEYHFSINYLQP